MFEVLGEHRIEWDRVVIFQVDDRVAPDGDPDRNLTQLEARLPEEARDSIRPMRVTDEDLDGAAARYAELFGEAIDLVHLGLGPDGHTASLIPGDPVLEITDRLVAVVGEYQGRPRMTLTYPALNAAREVVWLITGEDKREALARLLDGDESIPAGRVTARDAVVVCDAAAAG